MTEKLFTGTLNNIQTMDFCYFSIYEQFIFHAQLNLAEHEKCFITSGLVHGKKIKLRFVMFSCSDCEDYHCIGFSPKPSIFDRSYYITLYFEGECSREHMQ